jgi:trypsin
MSCSGVLIRDNQVLTAAHCIRGGSIVLTFSDGESRNGTAVAADSVMDVALIVVEDKEEEGVPIPLLRENGFAALVGTPAVMAGFGLTERGSLALEPRFLVQDILSVNEVLIEVDGRGVSGGCFGDSGGPLLVRDEHGALNVAGIMLRGSASCVGVDVYVRADQIRLWIERVAPGPGSSTVGCDGLSREGLCRRGRAMYCEGDIIHSDACSLPSICGWAESAAGFRCIPAELDPCDAVGDSGQCLKNIFRRCEQGILAEEPCEKCQKCGRNASGFAECIATR